MERDAIADALLMDYMVPENRVFGVSQILGRPGVAVIKNLAKRAKSVPDLQQAVPSPQQVPSLQPSSDHLQVSQFSETTSEHSKPDALKVSGALRHIDGMSLAELRRITLPPAALGASLRSVSSAGHIGAASPESSTMTIPSRSNGVLEIEGSEVFTESEYPGMQSRAASRQRRHRPRSWASTSSSAQGEESRPRSSSDVSQSGSGTSHRKRAPQKLATQSEFNVEAEMDPLENSTGSKTMGQGSIKSDLPPSPNAHKKPKESNPFVEYEDKEQRTILERRWLQQDAAYMATRTKKLQLLTVRQRLLRKEALESPLEVDPGSVALPRVSEKKLKKQQEAAAAQKQSQRQAKDAGW
eukprot:CAMPEP_0197653214 /NCGR_PEP_ID=MMETSP1338-20131121/34920_1 /TAXON_ID=43686 ORGANISM="Pelagodinium beii, Strain RCC1491" /NCGR_SAMPLE_ID=MMETSP1338 /ASSEMBLY_ACC=CAM_ASM_000754 /LENGTH=354 /DNA_ID=CAMNT_0043228249 /DNA_START=74 /DNA_END=1135 /DNA_ORIENTATION=+